MKANDIVYRSTVGAVLDSKSPPAPLPRPLSTIAREIESDWSAKGKGVNFAARPYLDAMKTLHSVADNYFHDSGVSVVLYFLSNAGSWRGDVARRVKAELKGLAS
jgi:hypothetical protein